MAVIALIIYLFWDLRHQLEKEKQKNKELQTNLDACKENHKEKMDEFRWNLFKLNNTIRFIEYKSNDTRDDLDQERQLHDTCKEERRQCLNETQRQQNEIYNLKMHLMTLNTNWSSKHESEINECNKAKEHEVNEKLREMQSVRNDLQRSQDNLQQEQDLHQICQSDRKRLLNESEKQQEDIKDLKIQLITLESSLTQMHQREINEIMKNREEEINKLERKYQRLEYDLRRINDSLNWEQNQHKGGQGDADRLLAKYETAQGEIINLTMKLVTLEANLSICTNGRDTYQARLEKCEKTSEENTRKYTHCLKEGDRRCEEKSRNYAHCAIELENCKIHLNTYKNSYDSCQKKLNERPRGLFNWS